MQNIKKLTLLFTIILCTIFAANNQPANAEDAQEFGALKSNEVNLRIGPSTNYEIRKVIHRRHLPIEILTQTNDHLWREVRVPQDAYGENYIEGWIHRDLITATPYVMIINDIQTLRRRPNPESRATARAEAGVIGSLEECNDAGWCKISIASGAYKGWIEATNLWGATTE